MPIIEITPRDSEKDFPSATGISHQFQLKTFHVHVLEVEDVHFHHNSAVLLPDWGAFDPTSHDPDPDRITGLAVLRACYLHAQQNPAQKALITGHTDTSGPDDYNLKLSKLRADNVLAALTGDRAAWVTIAQQKHKVEDYQQILQWVAWAWGWDCYPGPKDNQSGPRTQKATRTFQTNFNREFNAAIGVDGAVGPETWGAFFDMYMHALKGILHTDDAGLSGMRQAVHFLEDARKTVGCGENFPIEQRGRNNFRSATNRRVEVLFFDPGEEPILDCHPQPGGCIKEKCEVNNPAIFRFEPIIPAPVQLVRLEVVFDRNDDHVADASDPVTAFARVGLWDHAFDAATGNLQNNVGEAANFVGADTRRFYFRVRDPSGNGEVSVKWRTAFGSGADDDVPATQDITCSETAAGTGLFVSRGLLLVTDAVDKAQATHSGLAAGIAAAGSKDHRLRRITVDDTNRLDSVVIAEYTPASGGPAVRASAAVFNREPEERRILRVHLVNVRNAVGGTGALTAARRNLVKQTFQSIYAACGIFADVDEIMLDPPASCVGWPTRYPTDPLATDPAVEGFTMPVNFRLVPSASQVDLINAVRALPSFNANDIYIVCVAMVFSAPVPAPPGPGLNGGGGEAFPDSWTDAGAIARGFAFVGTVSGITEFAEVHEATHITTNLANNAGGHFDLGAAAAGAVGNIDGKNLMNRFFLNNTLGVSNPKRLWNQEFTNANRAPAMILPAQIDAIRGSRFVHAL